MRCIPLTLPIHLWNQFLSLLSQKCTMFFFVAPILLLTNQIRLKTIPLRWFSQSWLMNIRLLYRLSSTLLFYKTNYLSCRLWGVRLLFSALESILRISLRRLCSKLPKLLKQTTIIISLISKFFHLLDYLCPRILGSHHQIKP